MSYEHILIEKVLYDYLTERLSVDVVMTIPENPPCRFVLVELTGHADKDLIQNATFAIQSYGKDLLDAAEINREVLNVMEQITNLDEVAGCHLNTYYNFTDTETKKPRYQALYDISHY